MCNGLFSKVLQLFGGRSYHRFAAAGGIYAGLLSSSLLHLKNLMNSSRPPLACIIINKKSYLSFTQHTAGISHLHHTKSLNPCLCLEHVNLWGFFFLSVPSGCWSECQYNFHIVYWREPLTNLMCVNPDLLFDDMNLNNETNWQIQPERKILGIGCCCFSVIATGGKPCLYTSGTSIYYKAAGLLCCWITLCTVHGWQMENSSLSD